MHKIMLEGVEYNVEDVSYETVKENWNEYRLESGEKLRVKLVTSGVLRVLDDTGLPLLAPDGTPRLFVKHKQVIEVAL